MRLYLPAFVVVALTCGFAARAPAESGQDRLIQLDQILISHDLCDFPLSDEQSAAAKAESEGLVESLEMDPDEAQRLYDQYAEAMRRQKASGLCDSKGEWAKTYEMLVAGFAKT